MGLTEFNNEVDLKFKLFNSIFLTLPLDGIQRTGMVLPILREICADGLKKGKTPVELIEHFFDKHTSFTSTKQKLDFMFRILQYVERQVVLVDSLEDAAFGKINELDGQGSLNKLIEYLEHNHKIDELRKMLDFFGTRIVLTAHPTQFYPGTILALINDLTIAIEKNDIQLIQVLMQQLGKTPFFKKEKPTPLDEATNLMWYLENIFYQSAGNLYDKIIQKINNDIDTAQPGRIISFGFWPGGDRDGNPSVNAETTIKVAEKLRTTLLRNYDKDLKNLKRRLTFQGIYELIAELENEISRSIEEPDPSKRISLSEFEQKLDSIESKIIHDHERFYHELLRSFRNKVRLFGFHFAGIDIRQDSRVIENTIDRLFANDPDSKKNSGWLKLDDLLVNDKPLHSELLYDPVQVDTINSFYAIRKIQENNGELACNRYIISNCKEPEDVGRVMALARMTVWKQEIPLDIVPLFETIEDLANSENTMNALYENPIYREHLKYRENKQTIMLGFSDGTKDGGYLSANWEIYKAKERLTRLSCDKGINVIFFDGRGGPPARGGGDTHNFYASLGNEIANREIQVTIQGQTVSSRFGTIVSAGYYMELLLTAGLENQLLPDLSKQLTLEDRVYIEDLSRISFEEYTKFKNSVHFLPYLDKMSTLKYYGMANIGSRPTSRKQSEKLVFSDLRAIPFVGSWSQMKQNVPGFFGLGTALKKMEENKLLHRYVKLYKHSLFFKTLIDNSMQSLSKSNFDLTAYMKEDAEFGDFWKWIFSEYRLSCEMLLKISGQNELLESNLSSKRSIELRESIVLPLAVIQQYALIQSRKMEENNEIDSEDYKSYKKLIVRSLYGNINASRNSA